MCANYILKFAQIFGLFIDLRSLACCVLIIMSANERSNKNVRYFDKYKYIIVLQIPLSAKLWIVQEMQTNRKSKWRRNKKKTIGITRTVDYVKVKFTHKLLADCLIWPKAQRQTQCCDSVRCDAHALNICLTIWLFVYWPGANWSTFVVCKYICQLPVIDT